MLRLLSIVAWVVFSVSATAAREDPAEREWNQPRGDSSGSRSTNIEPIRSQPTELWSVEADEVLATPVSWGGIVYAVILQKGRRMLLAIDVETGEERGSTNLGSGDAVQLVISQGMVGVVSDKKVRLFQHRGSTFRSKKTLSGAYGSGAVVVRGVLVVRDGSTLQGVDMRTGKIAASLDMGSGIVGDPAAVGADAATATIAVAAVGPIERYRGEYLQLRLARLRGVGTRKLTLRREYASGMTQIEKSGPPSRAHVAYVPLPDGYGDGPWYVRSPWSLEARDGSVCAGALFGGSAMLSTIATEPAVSGSFLYGFSEAGALIRQGFNGLYWTLVEAGELPSGVGPGDVAHARGVLYVGNWAVEVESRRILWSLPDLVPSSSLVPVRDHHAVVATEGQLLCLVDPNAVEAPVAGAGSGPTRSPVAVRPDAGDGLVTEDGRFVQGAIVRDESGQLLVRAEGRDDFATSRGIALVIDGGRPELMGDEYPVYVAWRNALRGELFDAFETLFESYRKTRLLDHCQRLIDEELELGLSAEQAEALQRRLGGVAPNTSSNRDAQARRIGRDETKIRKRTVKAHLSAAQWCKEAGAPMAASVLLADAMRVLPDDGRALEAASALVPDPYPVDTEEDPVRGWLQWSRELLPAGALFLAPEDPAWAGAKTAPWNQGALGFRTRNLVFFTMERDPAIVGACLRNGEGTVRTLCELLPGRGLDQPPTGDEQRLDVRLHSDRKAYLQERQPDGEYAMPWTAGYYSPAERVSRFFVPRKGQNREPLGRNLFKVLSHEVTHQFLEQRWAPRGRRTGSSQEGYWLVEGFARFIEDQIVEMGRRGGNLDDRTVRSLDATSGLAAMGELPSTATFVRRTPEDFAELGTDAETSVQLQHTLASITLSPKSIFYEHAGSLVYFLMSEAGPKRRRALLKTLKAYYHGRRITDMARALGFESAEALESEFREFLAGLRSGSR